MAHPKKGKCVDKYERNWKPTKIMTTIITKTFFKSFTDKEGYLQNGGSRHNTNTQKHLDNIKPHTTNSDTFRNKSKRDSVLEHVMTFCRNSVKDISKDNIQWRRTKYLNRTKNFANYKGSGYGHGNTYFINYEKGTLSREIRRKVCVGQ